MTLTGVRSASSFSCCGFGSGAEGAPFQNREWDQVSWKGSIFMLCAFSSLFASVIPPEYQNILRLLYVLITPSWKKNRKLKDGTIA